MAIRDRPGYPCTGVHRPTAIRIRPHDKDLGVRGRDVAEETLRYVWVLLPSQWLEGRTLRRAIGTPDSLQKYYGAAVGFPS